MTHRHILILIVSLATAMLVRPALATIDFGIVSVDNTALLTGYETSDLQITTDIDWTAGALLLELTSGSIYQHAQGSATPTTNLLLLSLFPELAFDTSVSRPGGETIGAGGDVGGDTFAFSTTELDVSFYNTDGSDTGTFSVGRITLSDDAVGTWHLGLTEDIYGSAMYQYSGTITEGVMVHQSSSQFNGMMLVDVRDYQRKQYMISQGFQYDENGELIRPKWSYTLGVDEPAHDHSSVISPEPTTMTLLGLGVGFCLSRRKH